MDQSKLELSPNTKQSNDLWRTIEEKQGQGPASTGEFYVANKEGQGASFAVSAFDPENGQLLASLNESKASTLTDELLAQKGATRRDFMKILAAASAAMVSACTRRPVDYIVPIVSRSEQMGATGAAVNYSSTCGECASSCGVVVKTIEGRPIKVEGNPGHPFSKGGLCARGQSSVWNLFDPDRVKQPVMTGRLSPSLRKSTWKEADAEVITHLLAAQKQGKKVAIVSGANSSQTLVELKKALAQALDVELVSVQYEPMGYNQVVQAQEDVFGEALFPRYQLDKAELIVSIDADFLGTWASPVEYTKAWSANRRLSKTKNTMSRVVSFCSQATITASSADERILIRPSDQILIGIALLNLVSRIKGVGFEGELSALFAEFSLEKVEQATQVSAGVLKKLAAQLVDNSGKSLVLATTLGPHARGLQIVAALLNQVLGNEGKTIDGTQVVSKQYSNEGISFFEFLKHAQTGEYGVVLFAEANVMFSYPMTAEVANALKSVKLVVSLSKYLDETSEVADIVLPASHYLETWGEANAYTGLYTLTQPMISPLYASRNVAEALFYWTQALHAGYLAKYGNPEEAKLALAISGASVYKDAALPLAQVPAAAAQLKLVQFKNYYEYLKNWFSREVYPQMGKTLGDATAVWEASLRSGLVDLTSKKSALLASKERSLNTRGAVEFFKRERPKNGGKANIAAKEIEISLYETAQIGDGLYGNNPWLQETPDTVSKVTWANYLAISSVKAKELDVVENDVVRITTEAGVVELPVFVQPGTHPQVGAIALGYGHTRYGQVADDVGVNAFKLATAGMSGFAFGGIKASIEKTTKQQVLATTQKHFRLEGRDNDILQHTTLSKFLKNPQAAKTEKIEVHQIDKSHSYNGYKWEMAIDLNSCTGCNACLVACASENNIPAVGPEQVIIGRHMNWIRMDRYYLGDEINPQPIIEPMLCQHCDNAPCENVCPVLATTHSSEGLNTMTYNRCVGTRYCANNCPYKVRRFNYFQFTGELRDPLPMSLNPEVTMRTRGIIEKCSFCVQRIKTAKDQAKDLGRSVWDGEVKTACQQSCPADAISFGNINDAKSEVARMAKDSRGFKVLETINTKPSITYLAKVTNDQDLLG